jgi:hypothetical protein
MNVEDCRYTVCRGVLSRAWSKREKMAITKTIHDLLTEKGIRFLKKCTVFQYWYLAAPKVGRDKIGHFLCSLRAVDKDHYCDSASTTSAWKSTETTKPSLPKAANVGVEVTKQQTSSDSSSQCVSTSPDGQTLSGSLLPASPGQQETIGDARSTLRLSHSIAGDIEKEFTKCCSVAVFKDAINSNTPVATKESHRTISHCISWTGLYDCADTN